MGRQGGCLRPHRRRIDHETHQTRYLGAFVTPNVEEIDPFLKQATEFLPEGETFAGYTGSVTAQVQALYDALADRGMEYVDSTLDFNPDDEVGAGKRLKVWLNRMLPIEPVL